MSSQDVRSLINGAYSLKYKLMEQERLNAMKRDYHHTSRAVRERAHQLSKQTQQRRRALEEKKQAMAKAEEERRRKALEERKRQQNEATTKFRAALSRHSKPLKPHPPVPRLINTIPVDIYLSNRKLKISPIECSTSPPQEHVVLGQEVEVSSTSPSLDDVLNTIRGDEKSRDIRLESGSVMNKSLVGTNSPLFTNHTHPSYNDKVLYPVSTKDIQNQNPIDSSTQEESSISSDSTLSLHDSLDSPNEERSYAEVLNDNQEDKETPKETCKLVQSDIHSPSKQNQLETSFEQLKIQENPNILGWESSNQCTLFSTRKGILKKHSDSDISSNSSLSSSTIDDRMSKQSTAKHVRFLEDINEQDTHTDELKQSTYSAFTPRMKISLANRGGTFPQHVTSSSVRRLNERSSKNGITIHIPQAMYNREIKPKNGISTQLPVDTPVMNLDKIPTDDEISVLWSEISSYFHCKDIDSPEHFNNLPNSNKPPVRHKRCTNKPTKLWKRQQMSPPIISSHTNKSGMISEEEQRLLESIDILNNRLQGKVTTNIPSIENRKKTHTNSHGHSPIQLMCSRVRQHPKTYSLTNTKY